MEDNVSMISQMNEGIIEFNKNLNQTDLLMGGIGDTLRTITTWVGAGAISLGLKDMVSSLMKINEEATKSAVILGKKAFGKDLKENIRDISKNITNLQKEIGISTEKAKEFTNLFLEARVTENLHDATAAAAMFERATGATAENITSMYNEMYHGAKMSTEATNSVMAALAKVQHTAGLTEKGMNEVVKQAGNMAVQLRGFGATDKQIQNMTVSLGKYASSMEKVGVSAQEATAWVQELTNPDNIEKNIGLYAQMGISMSDALNGNFSAMQQGEQEFAQRIVDMGPIAGAAYARQFGYSYSKAMKTMNLEDAGIIDVDPQEQAMDSLKKASEEVLGITGKISKWFNQIKGNILQFGPAILAGAAVIIALLKSKILGKAKKTIADTVGSGIKDGIEGANIGAALTGLFKKNFDKANKAGGGYNASGDLTNIHKSLSVGAAGIGSNIVDTFKVYNEQIKNARTENAKEELKQRALITLKKNEEFNNEIENLKKLKDSVKGNKALADALEARIKQAENHAGPASAAELFKSGGKNQNAATKEMALSELNEKVTSLSSKKSGLQDQITASEVNFRIAKGGKKGTAEYENAMAALMKSTGKSYKDLEAALEGTATRVKDLTDESSPLRHQMEELGKTNAELKNVNKDLADVNNTTVNDPKRKGFLGSFYDQTIGTPIGAITNAGHNIKEGYGNWVRNNGGSFGAALGNSAGRGVVKGIAGLGKLTKSIAGLGLKMGVMGIVMNLFKGVLDKVMKNIQPALDKVSDVFSKIFDDPEIQGAISAITDVIVDLLSDLAPVLGTMLSSLVKLIMPLVNALLPPLLKVLSVIVKILSLIPSLLSKIPGIGKYFEPVATALDATSKALWDASDNMKEGNKVTKENTDAVKKSGEDKAADMRVVSKFGTTQLVENGATIGRDPSTAETAAAMQETKAAIQESKANDEDYKEQQKQYNEMLASGNFEIQKAVNLILEKLSGTISPIDVNIVSGSIK